MTGRSTDRARLRGMRRALVALIASGSLAVSPALAQTNIKLPKNKYTVEQDVQIGREAAAEVRKEYPIIKNDRIEDYLTRLGEKLVRAAPSELNRPEFEYSFTPVNLKEINAFALPGGPMFVNRGMIEAAKTEGEMAGVMAHEISHVALRHGTGQADRAQPWGLYRSRIGAAVGHRDPRDAALVQRRQRLGRAGDRGVSAELAVAEDQRAVEVEHDQFHAPFHGVIEV